MPSTSKASKKSKIVVLTLTPEILSQFPKTDVLIKAENGTSQDSNEEKTSESTTPVPAAEGQEGDGSAQPEVKKKRAPPNPNARKRAPPAIDPDGPLRERARPGPKKKPRLADGSIDRAIEKEDKPAATITAAPAHKLGPKANTGAINAGLRALDRSGKPCRRWEKKGLQLKSFTGSTWAMPTWKGSQRPNLNADGEVQSDSSSESKPLDVSGIASEKSASAMDVGETTLMNGLESSPAPAITV